MSALVDTRGEAVEAAAYESLYSLGFEGVEAERFGHVLARHCAQLPAVSMLNGVLAAGSGEDNEVEVALVDQACVWLAERGVGGYLATMPGSHVLDVFERERGFARGYAWMKFEHSLGELRDPPATDLEVRLVDAGAADAFGMTVVEGFGMPPFAKDWLALAVGAPGWRCFLAYAGDEPAGSGAMFVQDGSAWLGFGGTREKFRRRGAQGALLIERLRHARELGCTAAFTETGERVPDRPSNSYRNILRAGFGEAYLRPNLTIPVKP
ncbi:MAG: GNAT family N-acetyltransferase [Solirubrobacterales bacterium]